ncbi:unnamed protein product [Ranitomeya imitator]|uniref:Ig-like domain-containing protein n=1 Tax=Ranitomeya imitator TaxID=111125 RepID=A0ABN9LT13_9NEOB|nr:unnamed protein product [Ranitomeya imitator]
MKGFLCLLLLGLSVSSLELTGPSTNAARLGSDTRVPCLFTVDNPPVDLNHLKIFWHFLDKEILSYNKTVRTNSSRYSLSTEELVTGAANLTISNIRISDGGRYKCSVIYNSERREKRLWLDVGVPPQVTITDKTVVVNEESVLRCSATGFFPIDIEVKWFRGSERLSDVIVDHPQKNPDRTYSVNSTVTITPTEEDREQNFSCRVRHFLLTDPRQVHFQLIYVAALRLVTQSLPWLPGDSGIVGRWRAVCVTALQRPNSDAEAINIIVGIAAASLSTPQNDFK